MSNLLMHCGGKHSSRDELSSISTPRKTKSWVPISHHRLVNLTEKTIEDNGFKIKNQAHGLWGNGDRYFGLFELTNGKKIDDYTLILGLRNSHDKTFPASLALGNQVLVCDNLSFFGEVVLSRRHTRFIERDLPSVVTQAVGCLSEMRVQQDERISIYKSCEITDAIAHDLMIKSVDSGVIPVTKLPAVIKEWRNPKHQEFKEINSSIWRLFNAFTESFKNRPLNTLPKRSQVLHGLLEKHCNSLSLKA